LAVGDFNGDGRLDIAAVNQLGNSISILLGNGDGTFQPRADIPADSDPRQIAVGDFNGDGNLDLVVSNFGNFGGNTVSVFLGDGDGTFQPKVDYTASGAPLSVVVADFNGDGKLDLAVDNSCGTSSPCGRPGSVSILLGNGDGTFQTHVDYPAGWFPYTIVAGDFNGDGTIDVAVANLDSSMVTILEGAGDGTFPTSTALATSDRPVGLVAGDFNGDGKLDFAAGSSSGILLLLQNEAPPVTLTSLTLNPTTVVAGAASIGTVTLSGPAPTGGAIVTLSSSNPAAATPVAGTVTVPATATTTTFFIDTFPISANASATISATYNNGTQNATLAVQAVIPTLLTLTPTSVIGGSSSTGSVTFSQPAPAGAIISLASSNPAVASVPASIFASGTVATFTVTTQPVSSTTSVTISASYAGVTVQANLTVQVPIALVSFTLSPTSLIGGHSLVATVTLNGPAPAGGLTVALSSSNTSVASPGNINVAAGSSSGTVTIGTQGVSGTTALTISATLGSSTKTATLTVKAAALSTLTLNPKTLYGGSNSVASVTLNGAAPPAGAVVTLTSSNPGVASLPASVTIPGGASSATVTVQTQPVGALTSVTIVATYGTVSKLATLNVKTAALASVAVSPNSVPGGTSSTATITLTGPAAAAGVVVALSSSKTNVAMVPATVTVPSGATTATATVTTNTVNVSTKVNITGKYAGVTKAAVLTVQ
jgi:hypothetical protein